MAVTDIRRKVLIDQIRDRYDGFQVRKRRVRDEMRAKLDEMIAEATQAEAVEFAKFIHEMHDKEGLPWSDIAKACRKYGNAPEMRKLREAWTPEQSTDLAGRNVEDRDAYKRGWWRTGEDTIAVVLPDGRQIDVWDVRMETETRLVGTEDEWVDSWPSFQFDSEFQDYYPEVLAKVTEALESKEDA